MAEKNELTITKEKVLEAAAKCPAAKEVLKTMFPEAFLKKRLDRNELELRLDGEGGLVHAHLYDKAKGSLVADTRADAMAVNGWCLYDQGYEIKAEGSVLISVWRKP